MQKIHRHALRFSFLSLVSLVAGFLLLSQLTAWAQTITGNISGTVTDPSGAAINNANVTATNVANGFVFNSTTNDTGSYKLRFLPIGQYKVQVSATGFGQQEFGPFALEIGQDAKVNATLKVGTDTTSVQVNADFAPILNTEDNTIASTLSSTTINNIPLNGRNFSALTVFLPGSISTSPSGMSGVNAYERNTGQDGQTSVNGNRNQTNNYYLDGIEINETVNNVIGYNPAPDSLGEMKVISSNAQAEYGNVNGGDLIAVTKGGSNQFHGSVYYFLENYRLDSNTWANKHHAAGQILDRTKYTQPTFGATLGGPIFRNKLFFFIDYEGIRHASSGSGSASVATALMRSGDFSEISNQLYNNSANATSGPTAYTSNKISVVNPVATYLFAHPELYPLPNTTASSGSVIYNNYTGTTTKKVTNNQGDVRIDWKPNATDTITARWLQGEASDATTRAVLAISFPSAGRYPTKGLAINEVHAFSAALVNEFRAGFTRVHWDQGRPQDLTGVFGSKGNSILGIGAVQPYAGFAGINFGCDNVSGCSSTDVPTNVGNDAGGTVITDNTFQYGDNLTWMHGNHTFKGGFEITRYQQNTYYPGNYGANGYFQYFPEYTMNASTQKAGYELADFELDAAGFIGRGGLDQNEEVTGDNGQRQYRMGFFVQDDWKFRNNLTFNLGVRYEYDQPIYEVNNKEANINFTTKAIEYAGKNGASRALYNATYTNIMPRIGFNYQPNDRLVFRGGYGMTTYLEGTGANLRLSYNAPYWNEVSGTGVRPSTTSSGSFFKVANGFSSASSASLVGSTFRAWHNVKPSVVSQWSAATEYQLNNTTSLTAAYVGQVGQHLIQAVAYNQLTTPCSINGSYQAGQNAGATSAACAAVDPAPFYNIVGQAGSIVGTTSQAMSNYHALQASLRQRTTKGLEYTVNYTWAHAMTNSVGFFGVSGVTTNSAYAQNAYDNQAEYGPSGMDIRHAINGTLSYQLPFGHGKKFGGNWNSILDQAAGGWNISATGVRYTGFPVTISGTDNSATGAKAARPNHYRQLHVKNRSVDHWFGTDASATACTGNGVDNGVCAYGNTAYGTFGSTHPGTERAPGYQDYDLSIYKDFHIWHEHKLVFRVDGFNAFNISSYSNPDAGYGDSNFGQITDVRSSPRQFQFSTHYTF
jgi:hypothetical protein